MIYSRFGTQLTLVSKEQDGGGRVHVQVTTQDGTGLRNYSLTDLTADNGMPEINEAVAKLPWKVVESLAARRARKIR